MIRLYDGCYVELEGGKITGQLHRYGGSNNIWQSSDKTNSIRYLWTTDGKALWANTHEDVVKVYSSVEAAIFSQIKTYGSFTPVNQMKSSTKIQGKLSAEVIVAAKEAALQRYDDFDQFVQAIVEGAFKAQYGIEFVVTPGEFMSTKSDTCSSSKARSVTTHPIMHSGGFTDKLRPFQRVAHDVITGNESEKRISDSENAKGGQSELERLIRKIKFNVEYGKMIPPEKIKFYDRGEVGAAIEMGKRITTELAQAFGITSAMLSLTDYDTWLAAGRTIHRATNGSDEGYRSWTALAKKCASFDEILSQKAWFSFTTVADASIAKSVDETEEVIAEFDKQVDANTERELAIAEFEIWAEDNAERKYNLQKTDNGDYAKRPTLNAFRGWMASRNIAE